MKNQQVAPEALFYADALGRCAEVDFDHIFVPAAAVIRRLHAENERLAALVEAQQPVPSAARPVTPYTCPKCNALWLHWPAEQSGFGMDTLNCRSTTHCDYCEKGGVEQLQRLERVPAALAAPQPSPAPQADSAKEAPNAMQSLTAALKNDPEYAWAWHCNLAIPIMDNAKVSHRVANITAARLMQHLFGIDTEKHPHFEVADEAPQADSQPAPVRDYPPLPDFDSGDKPIWDAIFKWEAATPGSDAHRKANAVESAIIDQLRAYADETYALRIGAKHA